MDEQTDQSLRKRIIELEQQLAELRGEKGEIRNNIEVGKIYHVQRNNAPCLDTVQVMEITEKTVVVRGDVGKPCREFPSRYKLQQIEFVEDALQGGGKDERYPD